jgi:hypothetical protein
MRALLAAVLVATLAACNAPDRSVDQERPPRERRRFGPARTLGELEDERITEASGLVASRRVDGIFWIHNDSGDSPRLFCVRGDGRSCGTVEIAGAEAHDWEDIAAADGVLYIGDIGDNTRTRDAIDIYVVREQDPPASGGNATWSVEDRLVYTYPTGPFDAEALLVHPRSRAVYVVTKGSPSVVLRGRANGGRMRVVGALRLPGLLPLPTAGDISSDGRRVIVGTYDEAFELSARPGRPFDSVWRARPRSVALPLAPQREAIAYTADGDAIVSTSEGRHAALVERALLSD